MVIEFAIATEFMEMGFGGDDDEFCPSEPPEDLPPGFTTTSEEFVRDEDTVCRLSATGPIDRFSEVFESGALMPSDGEDGAPQVALTNEGGGIYRFDVLVVSQGEPGEADPEDAMVQAMMAEMFGDRSLAWSLTAPQIIATDGAVDGNTVSLVVPALSLFTEFGQEYSMFVRFGY